MQTQQRDAQRPRRDAILVVLAALTVLVTAVPAAAQAEPLRHGTIVGGLLVNGEQTENGNYEWSHECSDQPDCAVWLQSGCSPALAGRDPAWHTSIVDIADLADGITPRVFRHSGIWNWFFIQFWSDDCTEILGARQGGDTWRASYSFAIPSDATWMTVSGYAGWYIRWTLDNDSTPIPQPPTRSFYFAEGTTRAGFAEYLDLLNPTTSTGSARVSYVFADGGAPLERDYTVGPAHTRGIDVAAEVGMGRDVSIKVETPLGWVAERPMYFTANGWTGGHDQVGTASPLPAWNFAEGTTLPGFEEFLTLQNPGGSDALVTVDYLTEGCESGGNAARTVIVPAKSRHTVHVNATPTAANPGGLGHVCTGVSTVVRSTNGVAIVTERPLYFIRDFGAGVADDGHDVFGVTGPANEWLFAEGTTLAGFHQFLTLANPGTVAASVALSYQTERDGQLSRSVTVEPRSRRTVQVFSATDPGGIGPGISGASVKLTATQPILAERPLYVVRDFGNGIVASGGHTAHGARSGGNRRFAFASGSTEAWNTSFVTIQNAGASPANLTLSYYTASGPIFRSLTVSERARATVRIDDTVAGGLGPGHQGPVGLVVESDRLVVVERPSYFDRSGADGASTTTGDSSG